MQIFMPGCFGSTNPQKHTLIHTYLYTVDQETFVVK